MKKSANFLFKVDNYLGKQLDDEDEDILQKLYEQCADYSYLITGLLPGPSEARDILQALPKGKDYNDKFVIGIFENDNELIGVIDVIRNHPNVRDWYVGLMLLNPKQRAKGVGTKVYKAFEQWILEFGAQQVILSVLEENERSHQFWQKIGFKTVRQLPPEKFGNKEHVRFEMKRFLA